jgi:ribonuclease HI
LERKKVLFENGRPSIHLVVCKTLGGFGRHEDIQKAPITRSTFSMTKEDFTAGWFDGATQSNGQLSGEGGVLRINKHMVYKWTFNCGPGTNTRVERLGVWETLTLATRLHILDLQVFGDSRIIIDWLNQKGKLQAISLECWKDRIKDLNEAFRTINFTHIYRDNNKEADILSKKALQMQEGKIVYNQREKGNEDPSLFLNLY